MRTLIAGVVTSFLAACGSGSIDFRTDPSSGNPVQGVIRGREFVLRHASSNRILRGHDRFALTLLDVEVDPCVTMPAEVGYLVVRVGLPLEVGTWDEGDTEIESAGFTATTKNDGAVGAPAVEGWIRIEEFHHPWEDGQSWVTGALDLTADDGSWVVGRFEEVPLCYSGY